ncbi:tyrosine-type recombinase/integrase [Thalassomonas haliotis]|uniref:tyrosine-type recombinase/integrase n=1 Tax=Thalassomonas haliotis TaxID=485448 RepID=UPI0023626FDA|nr:tyrosine-type recombinase/integrase [Thalassomonas haliotis]
MPLKDILKPLPKVQSHAAIVQPTELGELIQDIDSNTSGGFCTVEALKLIPRIFLRPKEIRELKWEFVDFDDKMIRIPADDMKKDRDHLVPLSKQV